MAITWTDSTLTTSTTAKLAHTNELVSNVNSLISSTGMGSQVSKVTIDQQKIKAANITAIRNAINSLETKFNNNCCEANFCQTCQTNKSQGTHCQACQTECKAPVHSCGTCS